MIAHDIEHLPCVCRLSVPIDKLLDYFVYALPGVVAVREDAVSLRMRIPQILNRNIKGSL
jgi:hypothetical protein